LFVAGAQACDHVVFEGLDRSFSGIDPVVVRLDKLDADVIGFEIRPNGCGGHIVDNVQCWFEASFGEVLYLGLECGDSGLGLSVFHRGDKDGICGPIV
jgi:hypothetical protein